MSTSRTTRTAVALMGSLPLAPSLDTALTEIRDGVQCE